MRLYCMEIKDLKFVIFIRQTLGLKLSKVKFRLKNYLCDLKKIKNVNRKKSPIF